jgi:hypothetical protein
VIADVRLVGSLSTKTDTFQWAWETLEDEPEKTIDLSYVRTFGEVRGIAKLTTPDFASDQAGGWEMAAIAAYLLDADSVYRPPMDHLYWFMLMSNIRQPS